MHRNIRQFTVRANFSPFLLVFTISVSKQGKWHNPRQLHWIRYIWHQVTKMSQYFLLFSSSDIGWPSDEWKYPELPHPSLTSGVWISCVLSVVGQSNRLQPLSAAPLSCTFISQRPLLSTVASSTLISELCLVIFWNHSIAFAQKGGGTPWEKYTVICPWTS